MDVLLYVFAITTTSKEGAALSSPSAVR